MFLSFQSGFSKHHSRGSVLLKCQMISSVDSGNSVILLLLDFSAAFDMVDRDILISCLEYCAGIKGQALN